MRDKNWLLPYELAEKDEWRKWCNEIPFIELPPGWKFAPLPPFAGAVARFRAIPPGESITNSVSVYLDCYDRLGLWGSPYWEVYPYYGDTGRCDIGNVDALVEMIVDRSEQKDGEA